MQIIYGIIYHFLGGNAAGSFYVPYNKVKGWNWENFWIVGGIFSWLIIPPIAAWITIPNFFQIIMDTSATIFWWTYLWGVLWGVGGLMYGLGIRYLGLSLGNSVLLGFSSIFGSLAPPIYYGLFYTAGKTTFDDLLFTRWGQITLIGIVLCLVGIFICGRAGMLKDRELPEAQKKESIKEFNLRKGLMVCILSGILSACFNYGIEAGSSMAEVAEQMWQSIHAGSQSNFLFRNNVTFVVLLWGGLTTNFIWIMILNYRNKSFGRFIDRNKPLLQNYIYCALAGLIWFLQFFFYGMGESKLGNGASSWILHMSFIILVGNLWGFILNEWKGVSNNVRRAMLIGITTIIVSVVLVGYGNLLHN